MRLKNNLHHSSCAAIIGSTFELGSEHFAGTNNIMRKLGTTTITDHDEALLSKHKASMKRERYAVEGKLTLQLPFKSLR